MKVSFRYHEDCELGLEAWVESLPGLDPERREFARLCLAGLEHEMRNHTGLMPGARAVAGLKPPVYWWRFQSGWWMRYCVEAVHPWFRSPEVRIVVLEVNDRGPPTRPAGDRAGG